MGLAETAELAVNLNMKGNFPQGVKQAQGALGGLNKQAKTTTGLMGNLKAKLSAPELKSGLLQGVGLSGGMIGFQALSTAASLAIDYMGDAITLASDLAETQSKLDQVFTTQAGVIRVWARDAVHSMLMTQEEALAAAGSLGNFLQAMGTTENEAASMSTTLVKLSADLASFENAAGGAEEVIAAIFSGLSGETEPMRRFGVDISDAAVQARLLADGVKKVNGQFTQSQKISARYAIIMEKTQRAQGDVERTSDGLANSQRILDKEFQQIQTDVGTLLLPVMQEFTGFMANTAVPVLRGVVDVASAIPDLIGDTVDAWQEFRNSLPRDIENDVFNLLRIGMTGGFVLISDAAGQAGIDVVGFAKDVIGLEEAYDPLSSTVANLTVQLEQQMGALSVTGYEATEVAKSYDVLGSTAKNLVVQNKAAREAQRRLAKEMGERGVRQAERLQSAIESVAGSIRKDIVSASRDSVKSIREMFKDQHRPLVALAREEAKLARLRKRALNESRFDIAATIDQRLEEIATIDKDRRLNIRFYREQRDDLKSNKREIEDVQKVAKNGAKLLVKVDDSELDALEARFRALDNGVIIPIRTSRVGPTATSFGTSTARPTTVVRTAVPAYTIAGATTRVTSSNRKVHD